MIMCDTNMKVHYSGVPGSYIVPKVGLLSLQFLGFSSYSNVSEERLPFFVCLSHFSQHWEDVA
jgi:hypothetical protein